MPNKQDNAETQQLINNDISYCTEFLKAYNSQAYSGQNFLLSPQRVGISDTLMQPKSAAVCRKIHSIVPNKKIFEEFGFNT